MSTIGKIFGTLRDVIGFGASIFPLIAHVLSMKVTSANAVLVRKLADAIEEFGLLWQKLAAAIRAAVDEGGPGGDDITLGEGKDIGVIVGDLAKSSKTVAGAAEDVIKTASF